MFCRFPFRRSVGRLIRRSLMLFVSEVDVVVADVLFSFCLVYAVAVFLVVCCCWESGNYSISAKFAGISSMVVL